MLDSQTVRYGGWALILASLFYILTFIFTGILYGIFGLIATCLMAPSIWGLYQYYRQNSESYLLRLGTLAMVVGSLFIIWLYAATMVGGLVEQEIGPPGAEIETLKATISGIGIMFGNIIFIGTFLLALTSVWAAGDPKWLGWLGMLGSMITIPWFFFLWAPPILQMIPAVGFALVLIWMIVLGIRLTRSK